MKVAILAVHDKLDSACPLVKVIAQHLKMILDVNISVKFLTFEYSSAIHSEGIFLDGRIEWVTITGRTNTKASLYNCSSITEGFHHYSCQEVDAISERIRNNLSDVDTCILYDILFQERFLLYNLAVRKTQEALPNLRFIAYLRQEPLDRPLKIDWPFSAKYKPMPNTIYVVPSTTEIAVLAKQYNIPESRCRVIFNCLDVLTSLGEEVRVLSQKIDLLSSDILVIYPARLTTGKKFEKVTMFAAAIKNKTKQNVKIVFCDFPSTDINSDLYKALIKRLGRSLNLKEEDMIFTSDTGYVNGFPRSGVLDLFTLSNLFVCPSFSESFGLIALEAASRGNFLVLNEKVPALEELGQLLHTYFMRWDARNFGFDTKEIYYPSEQGYLEEHAVKVINLMRENPVVHSKCMVRKMYSPQWVWENQFAPLLQNA